METTEPDKEYVEAHEIFKLINGVLEGHSISASFNALVNVIVMCALANKVSKSNIIEAIRSAWEAHSQNRQKPLRLVKPS